MSAEVQTCGGEAVVALTEQRSAGKAGPVPATEPRPLLVRYDATDNVAEVTLDSPRNRNALSREVVAELLESLECAEADPEVRLVVLRAEGPVFCSGADLGEAVDGSMAEGAAALVELQRRIVALRKPVVARVHGAVRAGGIGLVAAADIAIAASSATFALTEVRLALAPAAVSLTVFPRLTSRAAARFALTGETFDGTAAAEMGLATTAVPPDELDAEVDRVVEALRQGHPQGLAETKHLINAELRAGFEQNGPAMTELSRRLFASEPATTAMAAFLSRGRGRR